MKKIKLFILAVVLTTFSFAQGTAQGIQFSEILNWTGTGNNVAMLVVDFNDAEPNECYAFGYRFDGTKTAEDMINDIADANPLLIVSASMFLNDITYGTQEGIGGNPYYWSTFIFEDPEWEANLDGIGEVLTDSMMFGCSYTDWEQVGEDWFPINKPENPIAAPTSTVDISSYASLNFRFYPNPATDYIIIETEDINSIVEIIDITGRTIKEIKLDDYIINIDLRTISNGTYFINRNHNNIGKFILNK